MTQRNSRWTLQEEEALKQLKQEQEKCNIVNWSLIAKTLNQKFSDHSRTSKQCREKYINHIKISNRSELYQEWTKEELKILTNIYMEKGSSWSLISSRLQNRSQNCVKNKFNTCLRKAANILFKQETGRKNITYKILCSMIDFVNQLKKKIEDMNLTVNYSSGLFIFRAQIIKLCFQLEEYQKQNLINLIKLIKLLNGRIRCFGIFKLKIKRKCPITEKGFFKICISQKIIAEWNLPTSQIKQHNPRQMNTFTELNQQFQSQELVEPMLDLQIQQILQFYRKGEQRSTELFSLDQQLQMILGQEEKYSDNHLFFRNQF